MGPDSVARLFVSKSTSMLNYSRWYRKVHNMSDKPDVVLAGDTDAARTTRAAWRWPAASRVTRSPTRLPRADLAATWGRNTTWQRGVGAASKADTDVAGPRCTCERTTRSC